MMCGSPRDIYWYDFKKLGYTEEDFVEEETIRIGKDLDVVTLDTTSDEPLVTDSLEIPLNMDSKNLPKETIWLISGKCTTEQLKTNNWRKVHGLPMKRRDNDGSKKNICGV
jgi:hypothetical protein